MIRNLKILGSALALLLGLAGLAASPALAVLEFHAEEEGVEVRAWEAEAGFKFGTRQVVCPHQHLTGEIPKKMTTNHPFEASYYECSGLGNAEVRMNECKYRAQAGKLDGEGNMEGELEIECPGTKVIEIEEVASGTLKCKTTIPAQKALTKITYFNANVGKGKERYVIYTIQLSNIKYTFDEGTGLGKCTAGTFNNGVYETLVNMKAYGSEMVGFWVA